MHVLCIQVNSRTMIINFSRTICFKLASLGVAINWSKIFAFFRVSDRSVSYFIHLFVFFFHKVCLLAGFKV